MPADPSIIKPEDCPEPFWHDTHRYCPCCSFTEPHPSGLYRSRPTTIEAVEWDGEGSIHDVFRFAGDKVAVSADGDLTLLAGKDGAQEWVPVPKGHWLVSMPGDRSDIWPVDPTYFATKYERA